MSSIIEHKPINQYWGQYKVKRKDGVYYTNNYIRYGDKIAYDKKPCKKIEQELREILLNQYSTINITI